MHDRALVLIQHREKNHLMLLRNRQHAAIYLTAFGGQNQLGLREYCGRDRGARCAAAVSWRDISFGQQGAECLTHLRAVAIRN